jgi:hypothetical protein
MVQCVTRRLLRGPLPLGPLPPERLPRSFRFLLVLGTLGHSFALGKIVLHS